MDAYSYDYYYFYDHRKAEIIISVVTWMISVISLLLTPMAIYTAYSLVRKDRVAPVYVINLLISDLIQLCSITVSVTVWDRWIADIFRCIYISGLGVSVGFMVCIAFERYLAVTGLLCSCFRQTLKIYEVVCAVVWGVPLFFLLRVGLFFDFRVITLPTNFAILFLLPYPLLIFLLAGTLKALPAASHVPPDEKRRTVAVLILVLLVYTLLFLPAIICILADSHRYMYTLEYVILTIPRLSPLVDMFLYVFLRKGAADKLLVSLCRCRMESNDINTVDDDISTAV